MAWDQDNGNHNNSNSNNNKGGPWGQNPWGNDDDERDKNKGRQKPPHSGNGQQDFDELFKKGQETFKKAFHGGGNGGGRNGDVTPTINPKFIILAAFFAGVILWSMKSFYQVQSDELGVEMIFGVPKDEISTEGLNFHFWPVEKVEILNATRQRRLNIGSASDTNGRNRGDSQDGLMLSGDQNIVDVRFSVLWRVSNPQNYIFNVRDPEAVVRNVAESAMREYVGQSIAEDVRTTQRAAVETRVQELIQVILDEYQVGITVDQVVLDSAEPPSQVADAFEEVQRAQQDQDKVQQEATKYRNTVLGKANGDAARFVQEAEGYKQKSIAEALGESERFEKVLAEYQKAEDVTRTRLYLEMMEKVLSNSDKVILDQNEANGNGVLPYLPLPEITKRK